MGSAGQVVGDAAAGAALGSAAGPWGTAAGAVVGGLYGAFSGGGNAPATPQANPQNFQLGNGNGQEYTNQIAGALANRGNAADATAALQQSQAQGAYGVAAGAQGIGAPQIQQNAADWQRQIAALGGTNSSAANLTGAASQLQQMGTDGMPLGLAAAQLRQGEDANMNQALALAHSGRSLGGGASALQAAQFQNAQTGQVTNQQAATANIQEQQQNQQYKLAALGASQQGYGSAGSLYGQAGTQAAGINQTDLGVQQTNAQLQQGQQGINTQTSATFGQMGAGLNASALGEQQLGQGYQAQGIGVLNSQLAANGNLSSQSLGQGNIGVNNQIAQNTENKAEFAAGLQGGAQILAAAGQTPPTASDRNAKIDIQPANMALSLQPQPPSLVGPTQTQRLAALGGGHPTLRPAGPMNGTQAAINTRVAPAPSFDPNAMPSGAPLRAAPPNSAAQASALGQLSGAGTYATSGPVGVISPGADPYLAAIAGTNNMYLPNGYIDRKYQAEQSEIARNAAATSNHSTQGQMDSLARAVAEANAAPSRPVMATRDSGATWGNAMAGGVPAATQPSASRAPYQSNGVGATTRASDVHSKTRIQELESQLAALRPQQPDTGALDAAYRSQGGTPIAPPAVDLRPAQGYSYEYKDPGAHGQGRFYGPMAQDLEQTPAGASTVKQGPDGTKMVDTSRLALVNTSAISEQQRKLEALQSQLAALTQPQMDQIQRGFPASYPTPQQPESPWDRRY